ncbi:MAG: hypothetical protein AUI14_00140 [Actinobacteria bacterium 13_2_20CM_2_71_6]|nr:MAG: hypothetical protein AUI14_00140 [Actinobacteria bacterium 13_2_20CM_2_71_6]
MTAPAVTKRPALFLVPLAVGAVVAVALGVYGKTHTPTGKALFHQPFPSMFAMKVWLTAAALVFALVQLLTALRMYGKLGSGRAPGWVGPLHRTSGLIAFLLTVPVALHCLWALGFQSTDGRVLAHSLLGCVFYGAFVTKILTLHSRRLPGWALPWAGGALFTALVAVGATSAVWYFATIGVPS